MGCAASAAVWPAALHNAEPVKKQAAIPSVKTGPVVISSDGNTTADATQGTGTDGALDAPEAVVPEKDSEFNFSIIVSDEVYQSLKKKQVEGLKIVSLDESEGKKQRIVQLSASSTAIIADVLASVCKDELEKQDALAKAKAASAEATPAETNTSPADAAAEAEAAIKEMEAAAAAEPQEKKEIDVPAAMFSASNKITAIPPSERIPLVFQWDVSPSPFSEWHDPHSENWKAETCGYRTRKGVPRSVTLEYRQGMNGEWRSVRCTNGKVVLEYEVPAFEATYMRGFQIRWVVDGRRYLSPLELAPSLEYRLLKYPLIASSLANLPAEERKIENIPNERFRNALMGLQKILPMSCWDLSFGVSQESGRYIDGQKTLTLPERILLAGQDKLNDPAVRMEIRRAWVKSPVTLALSAIDAVGFPSKMLPDIDFFIPSTPELSIQQTEALYNDANELEETRKTLQKDLNDIHPEWYGALRVVLPPASDLKLAVRCRRPALPEGFALTTEFTHVFKDEKEYSCPHNVKVRFWTKPTGEDARDVVLDSSDDKGKVYTVRLPLPHNEYRYMWLIDGQPFLDDGIPVSCTDFQTYCVFKVDASVAFGIGVIA